MLIVDDWTHFTAPYEKCALTLGNFDGLHLGHRKLIGVLKQRAAELSLPSCVITYVPSEKNARPAIYTLQEKKEHFQKIGVDFLFSIPLTNEIKEMSAGVYLQEILLQKLRAAHIAIGYDHRFGKNRHGTFAYLQLAASKYHFNVEKVDPELYGQTPISSSMIKELLQKGEIETANRLLAFDFELQGVVVTGNQIGGELGFKTANLEIDPGKLIPGNGVYCARARLHKNGREDEFMALVNIGHRPTFGFKEQCVEAHLLGFEGELYGESLTVQLQSRIRDEKKFESREELRAQIQEDISFAQRACGGL